ncbi:MAG: cob(I)yrinic acid a,c-diamide adenosyltransferase [Desulfovibrionaceae bacterium]|nr:cob(I)yrinic acid a,c-diamide adenosyltransferase [Desulfovibrionaceae bacterium]
MILLYTGPGKGKTCACVGQVLRALGQNLQVAFGQFIKREGQAGEQRFLKDLLRERFCACGAGKINKTLYILQEV